MAIEQSFIPIGETGEKLDSVRVDTPAGLNLHRETVVAADPENPDGLGRVVNAEPAADAYGAVVRVAGSVVVDLPTTGAWGYNAGVSGTLNVAANKRVLQISATAPALSNATYSINGGQTITVPAGTTHGFSPKGNLVAPTITFTGTTAYTVEFVE